MVPVVESFAGCGLGLGSESDPACMCFPATSDRPVFSLCLHAEYAKRERKGERARLANVSGSVS